MKVEDLRPQGEGWRLRLHEKGGKHHTMPCHHALAEALHAYIAAAGIAEDRKGWLFRTSRGHDATVLSEQPMDQSDAWRMIRRRVVAAGIHAPIGNHTFRATGITAYLANGGALEHAQEMARARARPSSTTAPRSGSRRTRSRGSGCEIQPWIPMSNRDEFSPSKAGSCTSRQSTLLVPWLPTADLRPE